MPVVDLLQRSAETVRVVPGPFPASSAEEVGTLLTWLETPGTRLVRMHGDWSCPIAGAGRPNRLDGTEAGHDRPRGIAGTSRRRGGTPSPVLAAAVARDPA
jgi:DNA polymerase-3 subunit epsilon